MWKRLLIAGSVSVVLVGAMGCGDGDSSLPPPPDEPAAVAVAYIEGQVICDEQHALRAFHLLEEPPPDAARNLSVWTKGCLQDLPRTEVSVRARRLAVTEDAARVAVRVRWEGNGLGWDQVLRLRRTVAGWRVSG